MYKQNELLPLLMMAIAVLRQRGESMIRTSDVIRVMEGLFLSDRGTTVQLSRNAGVGRALSKFADQLNIRQSGEVRLKDDAGNRTRSAVWAI